MKTKIHNWWTKPNPEGVSTQDAVFMFCFVIGMFLVLTNLGLWLMKPEQEWIGHLLFPFK